MRDKCPVHVVRQYQQVGPFSLHYADQRLDHILTKRISRRIARIHQKEHLHGGIQKLCQFFIGKMKLAIPRNMDGLEPISIKPRDLEIRRESRRSQCDGVAFSKYSILGERLEYVAYRC